MNKKSVIQFVASLVILSSSSFAKAAGSQQVTGAKAKAIITALYHNGLYFKIQEDGNAAKIRAEKLQCITHDRNEDKYDPTQNPTYGLTEETCVLQTNQGSQSLTNASSLISVFTAVGAKLEPQMSAHFSFSIKSVDCQVDLQKAGNDPARFSCNVEIL